MLAVAQPPVLIRAVTSDEAALAETVLRAAFAPYVRRLGREQTDDAYRWLRIAIAEGRAHGAYQAGELVGVAITSVIGSGWALDQIGVRPARQGAGIGSRLLSHVEHEALSCGAHSLSLDTAAMMTALIRLYERHGYRETHRGRPGHGKDQHFRVYMKKEL